MEESLNESNRDQKDVTPMLQAKVTFPIVLRLKPLRAHELACCLTSLAFPSSIVFKIRFSMVVKVAPAESSSYRVLVVLAVLWEKFEAEGF